MKKQAQNTFAQRIAQLSAHRLAATSDDMSKVLQKSGKSSVFAFTESVNEKIDQWGIDTSAIFATDRNPKVIKRFIQFAHAVNAKDYKSVDKTTAIIVYALQAAGEMPLTTDALHYLASKLREGKTSPETRGISKRTISKLFGSVGLSTVPTQASRTVGRNGFLQLAGATIGEPGKANQAVKLNSAHPMIVDFFAMMNNASEGQLNEVTGE